MTNLNLHEYISYFNSNFDMQKATIIGYIYTDNRIVEHLSTEEKFNRFINNTIEEELQTFDTNISNEISSEVHKFIKSIYDYKYIEPLVEHINKVFKDKYLIPNPVEYVHLIVIKMNDLLFFYNFTNYLSSDYINDDKINNIISELYYYRDDENTRDSVYTSNFLTLITSEKLLERYLGVYKMGNVLSNIEFYKDSNKMYTQFNNEDIEGKINHLLLNDKIIRNIVHYYTAYIMNTENDSNGYNEEMKELLKYLFKVNNFKSIYLNDSTYEIINDDIDNIEINLNRKPNDIVINSSDLGEPFLRDSDVLKFYYNYKLKIKHHSINVENKNDEDFLYKILLRENERYKIFENFIINLHALNLYKINN